MRFSWIPWLMLIATMAANCKDGDTPNPADGSPLTADAAVAEDGDLNAADLQAPADAPQGIDAANPTSCPAVMPNGVFCQAGAPVCTYEQQICRCLPICSGVPPDPENAYSWNCALAPPADCPVSAPAVDAPCPATGLICTYGYCGITTATCVNGKWSLTSTPPPP